MPNPVARTRSNFHNRLLKCGAWGAIAGAISLFAMAMPCLCQGTGFLEISDVQVTLLTNVRLSTAESGRVRKVLVEAGDVVTEGAPLIQLDDRVLRLQAEAAALEVDVAAIESENDIDIRFADKSRLVAQSDLRRSQQAIKAYPKSISESELDQLQLMLERATLSGEQAERSLRMKALTSKLRQKQLEVFQQRIDLMRVTAPVDGMVVEILTHDGEWANVGDPVLRLIQLNRLRVEAFVSGAKYNQATLLHAPLKLYVALPPLETESVFEGVVSFVSPEVSPINGEIRLWADIENPDLAALRPGTRGRLVIEPIQVP